MNKICFLLLSGLLLSCSANKNFVPQTTDLVSQWDTIRPLANPDKGWYHHMLDNGIGKYLIQDETGFSQFSRDGPFLPAFGMGVSRT
ncbi:MAG: hypothetical protein U5K79_25110 [Cyclobacteriaceae bacterium]|nr:hypothetical protein [Cyclobacteriaceae bacterium]